MNRATAENFTFKNIIGIVSTYYELTKPGITFSVLASMLIGFLMGSAAGIDIMLMIHAALGTYLIAAGTSAHNMFLERDLDGLMKRTSKRPLPAYRIEPRQSFIFSMTLILLGLAYLLMMVNIIAGLVSLATTVIYLFAYTPLKRVSALNVFVGAIPGALPVVGGWAAATGTVFEHGMWILFGIIYCWQIPHVIAIAWVCKGDYEHAGFKMLPKNDPHGLKAAVWIIVPLLILFPTVYKLYVMDLVSWIYLGGALLTTVGYLYYGIRFAIARDKLTAKPLMFASFVYLPLIWIFIFTDWVIL
ncbi:MAG: protoheme IX farnesyltransferase [Balneolaceae bacterium]|nr:MAG: protoheme IX farnesyltransferase [Balneolaceae bacterium]